MNVSRAWTGIGHNTYIVFAFFFGRSLSDKGFLEACVALSSRRSANCGSSSSSSSSSWSSSSTDCDLELGSVDGLVVFLLFGSLGLAVLLCLTRDVAPAFCAEPGPARSSLESMTYSSLKADGLLLSLGAILPGYSLDPRGKLSRGIALVVMNFKLSLKTSIFSRVWCSSSNVCVNQILLCLNMDF